MYHLLKIVKCTQTLLFGAPDVVGARAAEMMSEGIWKAEEGGRRISRAAEESHRKDRRGHVPSICLGVFHLPAPPPLDALQYASLVAVRSARGRDGCIPLERAFEPRP